MVGWLAAPRGFQVAGIGLAPSARAELPSASASSSPDPSAARLFVGGIPHGLTEAEQLQLHGEGVVDVETFGLLRDADFETSGIDIEARRQEKLRRDRAAERARYEQAVAQIPDGPIAPKKVPKRWKVPAGESYFAVESGRGQFGIYMQSDGTDRPQKIKLRTPSFSNLSCMPDVLRNTPVAETIAIVGSIDVVMPEIDR